MHDKQVRRRRGVLAALVALSLILLTAYFGERPGGALHSVQRGFLTVISPIQSGADKALKPVRDLFGWVGDVVHATSQRDELRKQLDGLRKTEIDNQGAMHTAQELERLLGLDTSLDLDQYKPVTATVIERSPTLWYSVVGLDAGSSQGIGYGDPVIDQDGLVGDVTTVTSDASIVTLLTDQASAVSAMINSTGVSGTLEPAVGDPNTLVLEYLPTSAQVKLGSDIVTAGTISGRLDDLYPPELPIGTVTSINTSDNLYQSVHVAPFANLRDLNVVQVLTRARGSRLASATSQLQGSGASLPGTGSSQTAQVNG
ncbi:MAG TPA: rod shape-determining protein MreC [Solirubrobacteraceae bacterium]|nr:rod shape-determining protein MreC [Solirubrobacteraceae bacterium]